MSLFFCHFILSEYLYKIGLILYNLKFAWTAGGSIVTIPTVLLAKHTSDASHAKTNKIIYKL